MAKELQNSIEAADSSPPAAVVYRVLSPILHGTTADDQRRYEIGETVALAESYAEPLLVCGAVEPMA